MPFTPLLIRAILPNLAHDVSLLQNAALRTNPALMNVVQSLPVPPDPLPGRQQTQGTDRSSNASVAIPSSPSPVVPTLSSTGRPTGPPSKDSGQSREASSPESPPEVVPQTTGDRPLQSGLTAQMKARSGTISTEAPPRPVNLPPETAAVQAQVQNSRPESPVSAISVPQVQQSPESSMLQERDQIDYQATVNALTIQFLSEHESTRVAALKWLIMLHQKAPKKILAMDDGTFPALLKTLSDSSEEVRGFRVQR